jgi:hypothetical protein
MRPYFETRRSARELKGLSAMHGAAPLLRPYVLAFERRLTLDAIARVTRMAGQSLKQGG